MWTDINTKLKQGLVFCMLRGHVMGIPADYRDVDYKDRYELWTVNGHELFLEIQDKHKEFYRIITGCG